MVINQASGGSDINFFVRGARPNTLYTIWTVFRPLRWCTAAELATDPGCGSAFGPAPQVPPPVVVDKLLKPPPTDPGVCPAIPAVDIKPGFCNFSSSAQPFYPEGGAVAPTASMASGFTSGMGLDPGATFYTNNNGDGQVHVKLDYNLLGTTYDDGPPVGNATTVPQCATSGMPVNVTITINSSSCTVKDNVTLATTTVPKFTVTSSWLRKFVSQVDHPALECANYDPANPAISMNWQCIDPATVNPQNGTGLPRVWRYPFDHFRLAAHPDELTHGFIGGSKFEHAIDFVGRRCMLTNSCP
jgi:hypothetical protein